MTRAVLYFTGEAQAAEREEDEFDEDMYGEGDEDEDPDFEPKVSSRFFFLKFSPKFFGKIFLINIYFFRKENKASSASNNEKRPNVK